MKTPLCIVAIALGVLLPGASSGQGTVGLSQPVTYTTVAKSLSRVTLDLTKSTGIELYVDPELASEPVILRLNSVPLQRVMDRIADIAGAEWRTVDKKHILGRSDGLIKELEKRARDARLALITKSVKESLQKTKDEGPLTAEQATNYAHWMVERTYNHTNPFQQRLTQPSPADRLLTRVLANLTPEKLAELPRGYRYVYSTHPTRVQRELPFDVSLADDFVQEQNLLSRTMLEEIRKKNPVFVNDAAKRSNPQLADNSFTIRLVVEPALDSPRISTELDVLTGEVVIARALRAIGISYEPADLRAKEQELLAAAHKNGIRVSKAMVDQATRYMAGPSQQHIQPLDPIIRDQLMAPIDHDPLSLLTSDVILALAANEDLNVACLPIDGMMNRTVSVCAQGFITRELYETTMMRLPALQLFTSDGWFIGKPLNPLDQPLYRMPRPALQQYLEEINDKGYTAIEDTAELVLNTARGNNRICSRVSSVLLFGPTAFTRITADDDAFRLFASLSPSQRAAAAIDGGTTLTSADLDESQRELLSNYLYQTSVDVASYARPANGDAEGALDLDRERTQLFPDGVTPDTKLRIRDESVPMFYYTESQDGDYTGGAAVPAQVASFIAQYQLPNQFPWIRDLMLDHFKLGSRRTVTIEGIVGDYGVWETMSEDHRPQGDGVPITKILDSLPEEMRKQIADLVAKELEIYRNAKAKEAPLPVSPGTPPL